MDIVRDNVANGAVTIDFLGRPLTDAEFVAFCQEYEDFRVEMTAEGEIIVMPPASSGTGRRNNSVSAQLYIWARKNRRGETFDSSAGFVLPNGARRSPDASWISNSKIESQPAKYVDSFYRLCPDFVIELRSKTDRLKRLQAKMDEYIDNGAQLGWLIDPITQTAWIYRPDSEPEHLNHPSRLHGEGDLAGFTLDLAEIWR